LNQSGTLDRAALAKIAFANDANRVKLESILHPLIQDLALKKVSNLDGIIVYTIPLFVESKSKLQFDKVVAISCDEDVRVDRLIEQRGMNEAEARSRIAAQATDSEREAVADLVIDANCSLEELIKKADAIYLGFKEQL
jgi:dephospho-CoA kinase